MDIVTLLTIIGAILTLIFTQWQNWNNLRLHKKRMDLEFEKLRERETSKLQESNRMLMKIWNTLHSVRNKLYPQRIYIIQPHPLSNINYITLMYEIVDDGLQQVKSQFQSRPIKEFQHLVFDLSENEYLFYSDLNKDLKDIEAKKFYNFGGSDKLAIQQIGTINNWIGNIVCEWMDDLPKSITEEYIKEVLKDASNQIHNMLPPIDEFITLNESNSNKKPSSKLF